MMRLILLLVVIFLLARFLYRLLICKIAPLRRKQVEPSSKMVRCAYCQLFVLQDEAIKTPDNQYYCSPDHKNSQ